MVVMHMVLFRVAWRRRCVQLATRTLQQVATCDCQFRKSLHFGDLLEGAGIIILIYYIHIQYPVENLRKWLGRF